MQISDMIPGVNIIGRNVSIVSNNSAGWGGLGGSGGCSETPAGVSRGGASKENFWALKSI